MKSYECEIGEYRVTVEAASAAEAAAQAARKRMESRDWFATDAPLACSVIVNGVEYEPAAYAGADAVYVW
jgi:hypothetical protein